MNANQILQYVNQAFVMLNIGFGAFVAATPADHPLPWWVVPVVALLNAIAHSLPAPTGSALPQQTVAAPAAKAAALFLALCLGTSMLSSCTTGQPQQTTATLESGLTAAERAALGYTSLPRCPQSSGVCSDQATVTKIKAADTQAYNAIKAAEAVAVQGGNPDTTAAEASLSALVSLVSALPKGN